MKYMLRQLKRYVIIYMLFVKNSIMSQIEYRANFIAQISLEVTYLILKIIYVAIVYNAGVKVKGISPHAMLIFAGCFTLMTGIYCSLFYSNFVEIPNHVRNGTLDMYISKPVSLQFITTMRRFNLGLAIPNVTGGIIMISVGWTREGIPFNLKNIAGFIGFIAIGICLNYAIFIVPQLLSFWVVKMDGVNPISDSFWELNKLPMDIFGRWMQRVGIYIIPVFVISNFASQFVLGRLSSHQIIWALLAPFIFLYLSRKLWNRAVRKYTSVNN